MSSPAFCGKRGGGAQTPHTPLLQVEDVIPFAGRCCAGVKRKNAANKLLNTHRN